MREASFGPGDIGRRGQASGRPTAGVLRSGAYVGMLLIWTVSAAYPVWVPPRPHHVMGYRVSACLLVLALGVAAVVTGAVGLAPRADAPGIATSSPAPRAAVPNETRTFDGSAPPAAPAPAGLPVIDYWRAPRGLPADPGRLSTVAVTEGLRPTVRRVVYDAPGGTPRAFLPPSISGMPVTVPIVARRTGWVAVLLPSINRRMGWLTAEGWAPRPLRDQLVLRRRTHELTWLHEGTPRISWTVATGAPATATPLGRTFVLGRVTTSGSVYAGLDALVLGSVPDHPKSLPPALRAGHTAIHSWYASSSFGRSTSNGCIRVPRKGQRTLLKNIAVGTVVTVID